MSKNKNNKAIWSTRIKKNTTSTFKKVGSSISIDKRLFKEDIQGSMVHAEMLFALLEIVQGGSKNLNNRHL